MDWAFFVCWAVVSLLRLGIIYFWLGSNLRKEEVTKPLRYNPAERHIYILLSTGLVWVVHNEGLYSPKNILIEPNNTA